MRSGTRTISPSAVAAINYAGGAQEVERDTVNRYFTFGLSYAPSEDWGVRLLLPYIDRGHSTYGAASNPLTSADISSARITGLGDARVIGTWQGLLEGKNLGLQLGLKLPAGRCGDPNADGDGVTGRNRPLSAAARRPTTPTAPARWST